MPSQVIASKDFVIQKINEATRNFGPLNLFNKDFSENDWIAEDGGDYRIVIPKTEHKIINPIDVSVYSLVNSEYIKCHGIYDNLDYKVIITADDDVIIKTTNTFSGRIIVL